MRWVAVSTRNGWTNYEYCDKKNGKIYRLAFDGFRFAGGNDYVRTAKRFRKDLAFHLENVRRNHSELRDTGTFSWLCIKNVPDVPKVFS